MTAGVPGSRTVRYWPAGSARRPMMFDRIRMGALMFLCLALPFVGCGSSNEIDSITVSPSTLSFGAAGLTAQLSATGYIGHGSHPATTENVTNLVTWSSPTPAVATVSSTGLVTSVGPGTVQITATINGFTGPVSSSSAVTVTTTSIGPTNSDVTSIAIIPGSQSVPVPGDTAQFVAIGTTGSGLTENITSLVSWRSSSAQIATITPSGLATAVGQGTTTITAIFTNVDTSVTTATASFAVVGGAAEQVTSLTVYPGIQSATALAQQTQFFVLGTEANGLQYDVTNQVTWKSSNAAVATIGTGGNGTPGLATAVGAGGATFTAIFTNKDGSEVVGSASYTVTLGAAQEPLLSINIVPGAVTVSNKGMTGQYLAFGTFSTTPTIRDLTNTTTWISLTPEVVSINSGGVSGEAGGLATAMGYTGNGVIYAESTNPDGTVVLSNPQTFTCKDPVTSVCEQGIATPQFATITFYNAGENETTWLVTAPSDTGTADLIHCGPGWKGAGGSVCTGTYETGTTVTLTASPTGSGFGGWSSGDGAPGVGCQPAVGKTLLNSPTCTVTLLGNTSVGAIFY
jgi:hypothetical protein